jgi:hypothetical protein
MTSGRNSRLLSAFAALGAVILPGCSDGRPERVPVNGQVLIDGEPLTRGSILFHAKDHRPAYGEIGPDGRFQLSTYELGDGCVSGAHSVSVDGAEVLNATSTRWHAPKKYRDAANSGIVVNVDESMDPVQIQLSWDGGKPFIERVQGGGD